MSTSSNGVRYALACRYQTMESSGIVYDKLKHIGHKNPGNRSSQFAHTHTIRTLKILDAAHYAKTIESVLASKLRANRLCIYPTPLNIQRRFKGSIFPMYNQIRERK